MKKPKHNDKDHANLEQIDQYLTKILVQADK